MSHGDTGWSGMTKEKLASGMARRAIAWLVFAAAAISVAAGCCLLFGWRHDGSYPDHGGGAARIFHGGD